MLQLSKDTPWVSAPVRFAMAKLDPERLTPTRDAPERLVLLKSPSLTSARTSNAPEIFASNNPIDRMSESVKSEFFRIAQRKSTFFRLALFSEAKDKSAPPYLNDLN